MRKLDKSEISCKVKQVTEKGCLILLYKTARVDAQILDETYTAKNWTNDYKEIKGNLYCGIGVREDGGEFVWKWDCGIESAADAQKGEASDAFKRAGFKWGIGVELYSAPFIWANVQTQKNAKGFWELKDKFMRFSVSEISYEGDKIKDLNIVDNHGNVVFSTKSKKTPTQPQAPKQQPQPQTTKPQPTLQERIAKFKEYISKATIYDLHDTKYKNKMDALCKEAGPEIAEELTNIHNNRMVELANA